MQTMNALPYEQAAHRVAAYAQTLLRTRGSALRAEPVDLRHAVGRVLAEPLRSGCDVPPFRRAGCDGFALRAEELLPQSALRVAGRVRAGESPASALSPGTAQKIMNGAPLPAGADAVAALDDGEVRGEFLHWKKKRPIRLGEHVVEQGAQAAQGAIVLPAGTLLRAAQIALAAACGASTLNVLSRSRVAILTVGDELADEGAELAATQIRNSNAPMLAALVEQWGGEPVVLQRAADQAAALDSALAQAAQADFLLLSGGSSTGDFDLVHSALQRAGAKFYFVGVRMKPGRPTALGELADSTTFLSLPGNPLGTLAGFLLFAAPLLDALCRRAVSHPQFLSARLKNPLKISAKEDFVRLIPARCSGFSEQNAAKNEADWVVEPVPTQGSGDLVALAQSNCFLVLDADSAKQKMGSTTQKTGSRVQVLPFEPAFV